MRDQPATAVLLGASMSGLLAARALSPYFDRVVVVERDILSADERLRKGVPQAAHAHGLLASGYRAMAEFFPGLMDELTTRGASHGDVTGDFLWFQYGRWKLRHASGLRGITVSRPCLEAAIRRRVRAIDNVGFLDGFEGVRPVFDTGSGRVTGLVIRRQGSDIRETLAADLVVDATGRGSQSPRWLDEWGFGRPEEISLKVNVGYSTRIFERRPGDFFNSLGGIISGTPPASTRYGAVLAVEDNRWVVTLAGTMGDYPPDDDGEWTRFAATLPVPAVHELVTSAQPLSDIASYRFSANQRRFYERMNRFPSGYLVVGDAVSSFNPIYGQGMSVAAMEAKALADCLAPGPENLSRRFYSAARKIVDIPWAVATSEDLRFPQIEARRPPAFNLMCRYFERVHAAASADPVVCRKFFEVLNLLAPPSSLLSPRIAWRVLARPAPKRAGAPLALPQS